VIADDIQGLAATYDVLATADKKAKIEAVTSMLRSGQHAARQHRERTAALVRDLFAQTFPDNAALRDTKLNAFGVADRKPIMDLKKHPLFDALNRVYDSDAELSATVLFETAGEHESVLDQCALPPQKQFMQVLVIFHFFYCATTFGDIHRNPSLGFPFFCGVTKKNHRKET
jgi:hypothetical protein